MVGDDGFALPDLEIACRRLRFEVVDLVEAVLSGMDSGLTEREAVTMTIIELLQRRGAYHGRLKHAIDDGTIFQLSEGNDGPGGRPGRLGESRLRKTTVASSAQGKRFGANDA